ncbi:hypothetical protein BSL82_02125 [Tardibacter chloracetimidivorans]|uniref:Three-Cys-motif partner protein TcmP n=1 Tax=Tardibacter chloracetimidivorans TaxID=1921510 RepID=A0A1L3ZRJ7_9SPHN|nr:hypothetical protein BSL82_02125 [Tardibacter chloracetimidivorans]
MSVQSFGDRHTVSKLETVERYLQMYVTALKNQPFELLYVDACAGSGSSVPRAAFRAAEDEKQHALSGFATPVADTDEIIVGSAVRALGVDPPFHRYLFNDVKPSNVKALRQSIEGRFSHLADRVEITRLDANSMLRQLCSSYNWRKTRAVVFLGSKLNQPLENRWSH